MQQHPLQLDPQSGRCRMCDQRRGSAQHPPGTPIFVDVPQRSREAHDAYVAELRSHGADEQTLKRIVKPWPE